MQGRLGHALVASQLVCTGWLAVHGCEYGLARNHRVMWAELTTGDPVAMAASAAPREA